MKRKMSLLIVALLVLSVVMAACGKADTQESATTASAQVSESASASSEESTATGESYKFGFTCMTMNNPFFTTIEASVRENVEANGDTLITLDTKQDIATQIQQIEDMINQGIDLLFLCPVDSEGIKPALDELAAANIPVVNFDTDVADKDLVATVLVSNNEYAGQVVGEAVAAKFPDGAKIAILDAPYAAACVQRVEGFMAGLGDASKYTIVAQQNGKGDIGESLPIAEAILQANPDLDVFFCINDPSGLGALSAVTSAGLTDQVSVYGVDGSPDAKASIKEGGLTATGAQSPVGIGAACVEAAYKILKGETVDKEIKVPTFLIDATNVDQYGVDGWQ